MSEEPSVAEFTRKQWTDEELKEGYIKELKQMVESQRKELEEREKADLTRSEKTNVCFAIADAINKEEKKLDRVKEKISKGEKTFYVVGEGTEDIHKVWDRILRNLATLGIASKKITCTVD